MFAAMYMDWDYKPGNSNVECLGIFHTWDEAMRCALYKSWGKKKLEQWEIAKKDPDMICSFLANKKGCCWYYDENISTGWWTGQEGGPYYQVEPTMLHDQFDPDKEPEEEDSSDDFICQQFLHK